MVKESLSLETPSNAGLDAFVQLGLSTPPKATPTNKGTNKKTPREKTNKKKRFEGTTTPFKEAEKNVKDGKYGNTIKEEYMNGTDSWKKMLIMYLAGRSYERFVDSDQRTAQMETMVGRPDCCKRLLLALSKSEDRNLYGQEIGAETDESVYREPDERPNPKGLKYEDCYAKQIIAVKRYLSELKGAFGFLEENDDMTKKLVMFYRFQIHGTCFLAANIVFASYLGQMAFEFDRVVYPPDSGNLVRSFPDDQLLQYVVEDMGRDPIEILKMIFQRFDVEQPKIQTHDSGDLKKYKNSFLEDFLRRKGPGLVSNFLCTPNFHAAARRKYEQEAKDTVGIVRFDMQSNEAFAHVEGELVELKAPRGAHNLPIEGEIKSVKNEVLERIRKKVTERRPIDGSSMTGNAVRRKPTKHKVSHGDRSAHLHSPASSPDSLESSPRYNSTPRYNTPTSLDLEPRNLLASFVEESGDQEASQLRDRPPNNHDDVDETEACTHAMICIGGREENGKLYLLLQNSWPDMPLVEVSMNYFIASGARLSFVDKAHHDFFKNLGRNSRHPVNEAIVADCSRPSYNSSDSSLP